MIHTQNISHLNSTLQNINPNNIPNQLSNNNIDLIPNKNNQNHTTFIAASRHQDQIYSHQDLPYLFIQIRLLINNLQNTRIIQKIARPISKQSKLTLLNQTNQIIQTIQNKLKFIKQKSSKFAKSKGQAVKITYEKQHILIEEYIYPSIWKQGLRKTQVKINHFYKDRLNKFQKINQALGQRFNLKKIDADTWLKQSMQKMKSFCWCG